MFAPLWAFLREILQDGNKGSFGRVIALPYFGSSLALILADGIYSLSQGDSALDAGAMLASIGFALFTGSKILSIKGRSLGVGVDMQAPQVTPQVAPQVNTQVSPQVAPNAEAPTTKTACNQCKTEEVDAG